MSSKPKPITRQIPSLPGYSITRGGVVYDPNGQRCLVEVRQSTHQRLLFWQRRDAKNHLESFVPVHRSIIEAWYNNTVMLFPQDGICATESRGWESAIIVKAAAFKMPKRSLVAGSSKWTITYEEALVVWHFYQYMRDRVSDLPEKTGLTWLRPEDATKIIETIVLAGIRR